MRCEFFDVAVCFPKFDVRIAERTATLFYVLLLSMWGCTIGCGPRTVTLDQVSEPVVRSTQAAEEDIPIASSAGAKNVQSGPLASGPTIDHNESNRTIFAMQPAPANGAQLRTEAEAFFTELVNHVPTSPDAFEVKARYHLLIGESETAKQCWETALQFNSEYVYAWHGLGQVAMLNADFELAIKHFQKALALQATNLDVVDALADAYVRQAKVDEAIALLVEASQTSPESVATWVHLGQTYMAGLNFGKARNAFEQALLLSPDLPQAQQGLGSALLRLGDRDAAKRLLATQKLTRIAGKNLSSTETFEDERTEIAKRYGYAARVYFAAGDQSRGEFALRRATVLQPKSEVAWGELIGHLVKCKQVREAIAAAQEMCQTDLSNPSFHFTLGMLFRNQSDAANAAQHFRHVIDLAPTNILGHEALARTVIESALNLESCIAIAQKCVELRGAAADHELLAQAYAVNQKYLEAQSSLQKAIELEPENKNYLQAMAQLRQVLEPKK